MAESAFAYALVRVVPDLGRGEFVNAGVVLYARQHEFLAAKIGLDHVRLAAIAPDADVASIESALAAYARVAAGDPGAGPVAAMEQSERFGWLTAPASTMIQTSPTHTGICDDPERALEELFRDLVS